MIFALVLLCVACAWADDNGAAGAQIRLTKTGLQYLADIETEALQEMMKNRKIPDQSGGAHHLTFEATGILIHYLKVSSKSITILPNVGLRLSVGGITIPAQGRVHARYKKGWVKISDTTNVEITASGVDFSLDIKVDAKNGRPSVATTRCSANIGNVHLHFSGGLAWLYNLLSHVLENKLKDVLKDQMCKQGYDLVNKNGNKALQNFPVRKSLKDYAFIDYSFERPTFTNQYMDLLLRGEFLDLKHPVHSKLVPPQFDTTSATSKMIYIWLSDYTLNSAGEVFHKAKLLSKVIKLGDKIPEGVKPFLNTGTLKDFIPQLYAKYPDRPIQIGAETFAAPTFHIRPGSAKVEMFVRANINVVTKDKKLVSVFHIDISVDATMLVSMQAQSSEMNIGGMITSFKFNLAVGGSIIGAVSLPVDNKSIKNMVRGLVVDQANPILDRGFPIPTSNHLKLIKPRLMLVKDALRIDSDVKYIIHVP